jgi:hypothetical protein
MNEKIILTDCDGVLLDWEAAFHQWMAERDHTIKEYAVYNIARAYGIAKDEGKRLVKEFNESAWMGYLKAFRDARSGVGALYEAGYRFHCITSLSLDKKARRLRIMNLENIFGKGVFEEVICLDTGADKDEALAPYKDSGLYWIEDKTENAVVGDKLGLKSILIDHPHNQFEEVSSSIQRVASWADIVKIVTA